MKIKYIGAVAAFSFCTLFCASAMASTTQYSDETSFINATTFLADNNYAGIVPLATAFQFEGTAYTHNSLTYTVSSSDNDIFIVNPSFGYTTVSTLDAQQGTRPISLTISFPAATAVAFDAAGTFGTEPWTVSLSNGYATSFTPVTAEQLSPAFSFIGFTFSSPITSLTINDPETLDGGITIEDVQLGTAVAPEASGLVMLAALIVAAGLTFKFKQTQLPSANS